jgi:hypothetical protein
MIMLAGGGEKSVIATFATLDPDALVRATACQYLARLVEPSDRPLYDVLLERAAHDPEEDVRCAAIQHLRIDAPAAIRSRILRDFLRGPLDVQKVVTGRLAAWSETPQAFLAALKGASPELLVHALGLLREQSAAVAWSDLAPYAQHGDAAVLLRIADLLCDTPDRAPVTFWASVAEHWALASPEVQESLVGTLEHAFAGLVPEQLPTEERRQLAALRRRVEITLRSGGWGGHFLEDWYAILHLLNHPEMAKTTRFESPLGRLVVQLVLVTPDYEGLMGEELLDWIR